MTTKAPSVLHLLLPTPTPPLLSMPWWAVTTVYLEWCGQGTQQQEQHKQQQP